MTLTIYGDGTQYGDADAFYGRISAGLLLAQQAQVRETGLKVRVVDERVNRWEYFAGTSQNARDHVDSTPWWDQKYWAYRAQADVCILDNGDIIRVRVDVADRQVYVQTITDPLTASQWTSWSLLYSGDHYSVAIAPDGASTYVVYTCKADGLYRNNVKVWDHTGLMKVRCHRDSDGRQQKEALWVTEVEWSQLTAEPGSVKLRRFQQYFTDDITQFAPLEVDWNWVWQRSGVSSIERDDGAFVKISSYPLYAPADARNSGESILATLHTGFLDGLTATGLPRLVRGLPGQYGTHQVASADIFKLSDDYYYLIYVEAHVDGEGEFTTSVETPLVWQRSKDGLVWSEPVHVGFNTWGFAGLIESDGYVWLCGNGEVYRRPNTPVEYEITNYIPQVSWESPPDNQPGTGELTIANPEGVNDIIKDLSDRRIIIEPGMKTEDGIYEFVRLDDFWLGSVDRQVNGNANRLIASFGNIWKRLENPLRDVYNFVGRTVYEDWKEGAPNEPFAYYFVDGEGEAELNDLVGNGTILWTGWKGYNPEFHFSVAGGDFGIVFRYVDEENYLVFEKVGSNLVLSEVIDGVKTQLGSSLPLGSGTTRLGVRCEWRKIQVYRNGSLIGTITSSSNYEFPKLVSPGYVGVIAPSNGRVSNFTFQDLEFDYTSEDLIRQALALGDYHEAKIGQAIAKQYGLLWGPQTDLPTAADALRQLLEGEKLELIWRDGFTEVGQFKDLTPIRTLENEVISSSEEEDSNRRINLAMVDGNEHTWMEIDAADALARDRMIQAYYDLPELLDWDSVKNRAREEIRRGKLGDSPGGRVPLQLDLWRMDPINWVDNTGESKSVRIEGIRVEINQSENPSQRSEIETSLL